MRPSPNAQPRRPATSGACRPQGCATSSATVRQKPAWRQTTPRRTTRRPAAPAGGRGPASASSAGERCPASGARRRPTQADQRDPHHGDEAAEQLEGRGPLAQPGERDDDRHGRDQAQRVDDQRGRRPRQRVDPGEVGDHAGDRRQVEHRRRGRPVGARDLRGQLARPRAARRSCPPRCTRWSSQRPCSAAAAASGRRSRRSTRAPPAAATAPGRRSAGRRRDRPR